MKLVFHNNITNIYALPHYRDYYTTAPACALTNEDWNHVQAHCNQPAVLTRFEQWYPG